MSSKSMHQNPVSSAGAATGQTRAVATPADPHPEIRGGIVADRPYPPPAVRPKPALTAQPAATPHPVLFSGPGDASNAHADADHGAILSVAQVRIIFWGREWASLAPPVSMATVVSDVESILAGPYLDGLAQYDVTRAYVDRTLQLTDEDPPNPFSLGDAQDRVNRLIDDNIIPDPANDNPPAIYAVFLPSAVAGTALRLPTGVTGLHTWLSRFELGQLGYAYTSVAWIGNNGTRGDVSFIFSHELAESLTDPDGSGWQVEPRNDHNWNEVCDVCSSSLVLNGVRVSSYWSNQDNSCIVTDSAFTIYTVQWIWRPDRIEWMGGIDQNGSPWQFSRDMMMAHIRSGDVFQVHGANSGRVSTVGIEYLDPTHPYLATNTDGVPDDNLLALPQRQPS